MADATPDGAVPREAAPASGAGIPEAPAQPIAAAPATPHAREADIHDVSSPTSTARPSLSAELDVAPAVAEADLEKKTLEKEAAQPDVEAASVSASGSGDGDGTVATSDDAPVYTVFTKPQKMYLVLLASLAGVCSPLSSFIFYPATTSMAASLGVSISKIDLAVTTYMIVAGIVPALLGSVADQIGRRPVYLFALAVYFAGNLGLALQRSYPALLVLRMVQSAGSAGTIALGFGTVADVTTSADRGFYVGMFLIGSVTGSRRPIP
jgi:hypothetical protein